MKIPRPLHLLSMLALGASWQGAPPASASDFGSFSLAPGEQRSVFIGTIYRDIRVCNDARSAGSFKVTIGDHEAYSLGPGICRGDSGDRIALRNDSGAAATGIYQPYRSLPPRGGR